MFTDTIDIKKGRPWGFWATAGFSFVIIISFVIVQTIVAIVFVTIFSSDFNSFTGESLKELENNGFLIAIATISSALICSLQIYIFILLRKKIGIRDYLGLNKINFKETAGWLIIIVIFMIFIELMNKLSNHPSIPDVMLTAYKTARYVYLFVFAVVIIAPIFEELLFRGFLFAGLRDSKLGLTGAIIISSLTWSIIHRQYDVYWIVIIFIMGLIFGVARYKSKSIYTTILMHMLNNFVASVQIALTV